MKIPLKIAVGFFLFSFFTLKAQDYNFNVSEIPEDLKEDVNSVLRFNDVNVSVHSQRSMNYSYDVAVTVFNKFADDEGDVTIYYDKRKKIKKVNIIYYDASGSQIKKVKQKDFNDYSASGGSLFDDSRAIHYDYTPVSYPYTIHYSYEIETSNTAFIPCWIYLGRFKRSIQKSSYKITYPSDIKLNISKNNFEGYEDKLEIQESQNNFEIVVNDVKGIEYESLAPSILNVVPRIKFALNKFNLEGVDGVADNWDEYGKWFYHRLIKETLDLPEATKQKMKELTANVNSDLEKAKLIYDYVQNKVRYISVQIGVGGFKPMLASEVDELGYGDCKALTNYTAALLDAVNINSHHVLVYANRRRDLDSKIASQEGNHMILYLPLNDQEIWLECTSQELAFGELGDFTDNRDVLVLFPEGGKIMHTKKYLPEQSIQRTTGNYIIDSNNSIKANVKIVSTGIQYDQHLSWYQGLNPKDLELEVKDYFSNINNIEFSKIEMKNNKDENKYEEEIIFSAKDYGTMNGIQLIIPLNAFNKSTYTPKRVRNRKLPFEISRGYIDIDEIEIELPEKYSIEFLPENVKLNSKFGEYEVEISKIAENVYSYKRKLLIKDGKYSNEEYDNYRKFRRNIKKIDNSKIILKKS